MLRCPPHGMLIFGLIHNIQLIPFLNARLNLCVNLPPSVNKSEMEIGCFYQVARLCITTIFFSKKGEFVTRSWELKS